MHGVVGVSRRFGDMKKKLLIEKSLIVEREGLRGH